MTAIQTRPETVSAADPGTSRWLTRYAAGINITVILLLAQAVTAGLFVDKHGEDGVITVHGALADATWGVALLTAVAAASTLRRTHPLLTAGAAGLFVLALIQTGIGHLITDYGHDGLIAVHVPLAIVLTGFAVWLSFLATATIRGRTALPPQDAAAGRRSR